MGCACYDNADGSESLWCPSASLEVFDSLTYHCLTYCNCGARTKDKYRDNRLQSVSLKAGAAPWNAWTESEEAHHVLDWEDIRPDSGELPEPEAYIMDDYDDVCQGSCKIADEGGPLETEAYSMDFEDNSCPGSCTSVSRGCTHRDSCSCYAPRIGLFFWFSGNCGPQRAPVGRGTIGRPSAQIAHRGLSIHERETFTALRNATTAITTTGNVTASATYSLPPSNHSNESSIPWADFPAPCNASYVSFACAHSSDGIVHEPPVKWLGALLPPNATEIPPIPARFLQIHGIQEGDVVDVVDS